MEREQDSRARAKSHAQRTGRARVAIVGALFTLLLATGFLIGSSLIPEPPPDVRTAPAAEFRVGRVLYTLPAGRGCRHLAFDNETGAMSDMGTGACDYEDPSTTGGVRRPGASAPPSFSWGRR